MTAMRGPDVAELLINNGADINTHVTCESSKPLHRAVWMRMNTNLKIIELLLQYGVDANMMDNSGRTPLSEANDPKIKEILLRYSDSN